MFLLRKIQVILNIYSIFADVNDLHYPNTIVQYVEHYSIRMALQKGGWGGYRDFWREVTYI